MKTFKIHKGTWYTLANFENIQDAQDFADKFDAIATESEEQIED